MSPRVGLDLEIIVHKAAEIADKEGMEAVTLASVARNLNVRSPSLFNHINGLPSLKRELALYGLNRLYERLRSAIKGKTKEDAIFAMANAYLQFSREHPGVYEETLRAPEANDDELEIASKRIIQLLTDVLSEYQLSEEETIHAIRGLRSILHGYSSLEKQGAFGLPVKLEDSFYFLLKGYISFLHQIKNDKES